MNSIENKDILVIINPNSGKKRITKIINSIHSLYPDISTEITNNLKELENLFRLKLENFKVFIVVGGDGTVNEATKYIQGREDKLLGVFPVGSGNGFARELGFKKSIKSLIEDANKGKFVEIDILSINGENCINAAGLGFDSFVAHDFQKRNKRGLKSYIFSVIKSVFVFKPFNASLIFGSEKIQDKFQMITIANTRQFGNNAIIAPQAKPNNGRFELVLVKSFPVYLYPIFIIRLFLGTLKESGYLKYLSITENLTIESTFKKFHIDGDPKSFTNKLSIKIAENKVRVIKTKDCKL